MKIWIVQGSTGAYDDSRDWIAKAFVSEERAASLQAKLDDILKEKQLHYDNMRRNMGRRNDYHVPDELLILDPNADVDYTGASYNMYCIEVEE